MSYSTAKDRINERYGKLLVIKKAYSHITKTGHKYAAFWCKCDCSENVLVWAKGTALSTGDKTSCGCVQKEWAKKHMAIVAKNNCGEKSNSWKGGITKNGMAEYRKIRKLYDYKFKIITNIRSRLRSALNVKKWSKKTSFSQYIGCDKENLIKYIESKFKNNMSWKNYGEWQIDHIIPLSSAQTIEEIYALSHYTNLQPLWKIDNLKKGNKHFKV